MVPATREGIQHRKVKGEFSEGGVDKCFCRPNLCPLLVASVAQLVEQLTLNQLVLGSSPSRGTILPKKQGFVTDTPVLRRLGGGGFCIDVARMEPRACIPLKFLSGGSERRAVQRRRRKNLPGDVMGSGTTR